MTSPVSWRWNPYGNSVSEPPSAGPAQNTSTNSPYSASSPATVVAYSPAYIPTSTERPTISPTGLVVLPPDLAAEGRSYGQKYAIPKNGDKADPRAEVVQLSTSVQDLETEVQALGTQPIDIEDAKKKLTAANDRQTQFFKDVIAELSPEQAGQLKPLYDAAQTADESKKQSAQKEYVTALDGMLKPEQRKTLVTLQRGSEDAQIHLNGQMIGQRIRDARAGNGPGPNDPIGTTPQELLSLALAGGRALIGQKRQITVDRKLQDLYGLIMTPENLQKLQPQQQALFDAQSKLQKDPNNADLKTKFDNAKTAFDNAFHGLVDPKDRDVIQGFEAYQRHLQSVTGTLQEEADGERNFYELRTLTSGKGDQRPTKLQKQQFKLAEHQFELIEHNRSMRSLALKVAASPNDDAPKGRLDKAMVTSLRKHGDLIVETRQFDYDVTLSKYQSGQPSNAPLTGSGNGTQASTGVVTLQQVNDAKARLDDAKEQRQQLKDDLPHQPKKSFWDRALDIAMGAGEILGGLATIAFFGATGLGAVAGGAIVVDGLFRLGHSISDAANGTVTDNPLSALMQKTGVSRDTANRFDTAVSLLATVPVGVGGALTVAKSSSMLLKGAGLLGGLAVADGAQAGTRHVITNEAVQPFAVEQLTNVGLTQTQANYVLALGPLVGTGGLMHAAKVRSPGTVNSEFVTYDPANLPEGVTPSTSGAPIRYADWHTRGAPEDLRTQIATEALGADASPRAIRQYANSMRSNPLVVLKTVADDGTDTVVGAATVRTSTAGRFGRDPLGNRIQPKTAQIEPLLGDGEVKAQVIAAGVEGAKQFTTQNGVFWQSQDTEDASWVPDANLKNQRIRRDAPAQLSPMPAGDRPWGTTQALNQGGTTQQQLKNLAAIPEADRVNWPTGTRDLVYDVNIPRPLTALGQQWLGKLVHPMHKDSYLGAFNLKTNPINYVLSKLRPQTQDSPQVVGRYEIPERVKSDAPYRVATYYKAGTASDDLLTTLAQQEVKTNAAFGNKTSFNNHPPERLEAAAKAALAKLDLVVLTETNQLTGKQTIVGNAALTSNYKGFRNDVPSAFPWLADRQYKPGTTYLGHVYGKTGAKAGDQVVLAAAEVARKNGARRFDFLTQWSTAQALYKSMGAHPARTAAPDGAKLPMTVYHARFAAKSGEYLLGMTDPKALGFLHPNIKQMITESNGSPEVLQAKLDGINKNGDPMEYIAQAGDGSLLTRYEMDFNPTAANWRVSAAWRFQDAKWWTQQPWEWARPVVKPIKDTASAGGTWLNQHLNPYSLKAFEPGTVRSALRSTSYAANYGIKQSWTTFRGAVVDLALLQAATGNELIVRNDDRAIRPFNGLPGSESVAISFPWTGTLLSVWVSGPNIRGPAPIDDNGLQPLARASAPLTNPKGPKGAGGMTAARAVASEANLGIRWFGNNNGVSAVTAASIRLSPVNVNGRGDVPIQAGGPLGLQIPFSHTWIMPSVSHAFYAGRYGVLVRSLHVTLSGASQTSAYSAAERTKAYRSGEHWMLGSKSVTTGTGMFFTLNPAYGQPEFEVP